MTKPSGAESNATHAGALASVIVGHADEIDRVFVGFGRIVQRVVLAVSNWIDEAEREHREELKRQALARQPHWRKADVPRLLSLDIGAERAGGCR